MSYFVSFIMVCQFNSILFSVMMHCIGYDDFMRPMQFLCLNPVASTAVHTEAVNLLLLIYCFMYLPLSVCVLCLVFVLVCIALCPF